MPDLFELLGRTAIRDVFEGIGLPCILLSVQLVGKWISRRSSRLPLRRWFRILFEDLHLGLCAVSIGAVAFYLGQIIKIIRKPDIDFDPTVPLIVWHLGVWLIFLLACGFAGRLSRSSKDFLSGNTLIGMHLPNALGALSIFISYIFYENFLKI